MSRHKKPGLRKVDVYPQADSGSELPELDALAAAGLENEIGMLRTVIQRVLHLSQGSESLDEMEGVLRAVSLATARLATLLKAQLDLGQSVADETASAISAALADVLKDWKLP